MEEELDKILSLGDKGKVLRPFTRDCNDANLPFGFTKAEVTPYDSSSNPRVFLSNFMYTMLNRKCTHIHMCKVFP